MRQFYPTTYWCLESQPLIPKMACHPDERQVFLTWVWTPSLKEARHGVFWQYIPEAPFHWYTFDSSYTRFECKDPDSPGNLFDLFLIRYVMVIGEICMTSHFKVPECTSHQISKGKDWQLIRHELFYASCLLLYHFLISVVCKQKFIIRIGFRAMSSWLVVWRWQRRWFG